MSDLLLTKNEIEDIYWFDFKEFPHDVSHVRKVKTYDKLKTKAKLTAIKRLLISITPLSFTIFISIGLTQNNTFDFDSFGGIIAYILLTLTINGPTISFFVGTLKITKNEYTKKVSVLKNAKLLSRYDYIKGTKYGEKIKKKKKKKKKTKISV